MTGPQAQRVATALRSLGLKQGTVNRDFVVRTYNGVGMTVPWTHHAVEVVAEHAVELAQDHGLTVHVWYRGDEPVVVSVTSAPNEEGVVHRWYIEEEPDEA